MARLANFSADKALFLLSRLLLPALFFFVDNLRAEDVLLTVNVKKPVALTSDKFLSYTLDPMAVLTGNALTDNPERSINMAKALAPAYVRIGGPRSNSYTFERSHRQQDEQDPGFTFTEGNWIVLHRWAEYAGLDVLACIAPQHTESGGGDPVWDSRNALDLISFSDHMGFNTSWQLGYECQTRCDIPGIVIGRDVMRLRSMLDAFPRYSKSVIIGPDIVTYRTKQQQQYLQDYLSVAGTALSAISWHPDFASITLDPEGVSLHHDNLALDRDGLYRVVGRLISKKPLWLAESKPEECKKQFMGALVWARRLGNAAKLGVQVLMRQPIDSMLIQPTPDYWVSVLHKTLVGREVLDTKIATGNRTHVHFYCQCTKPSTKYEKGSLTVFGINLTPSKLVVNLKGIKIKTVHKYILLPGFDAQNRMFSETVLLNNEPLNLLNERELPEIKPTISSNSKGVALKLPSGGIGFWVIPGLKIKSCGGLEEDNTDKMLLKKLTKRLEETDSDEDSVHEKEQEEKDSEENISAEENRFSLKSNKNKRRRKYRYSEEDDAERRYRKLEARMDLERLEKLLKKRDSYDERKLSRGRTAYFGFEEKSQEKMDDLNEETGEEIKAKLMEYKNRLKEYERRKTMSSNTRDKIAETQDDETIDSEKVVEALMLISKMENAMKNWEKADDDTPIETLNSNNFYDVTSDLVSSNKNRNPEDMFLEELLKSKQIKRTSVPSKIEDQLRAIYQMLAEEQERRQKNLEKLSILGEEREFNNRLQEIGDTLPRTQRDTEKKFGEDPLGLRKEGLFRKRMKNDDAKERRIDRKRKKDKDGQPIIFDHRTVVDSNENNFYGFHQREPLNGFPEGDVFLTTGTSSEEAANDYDYVMDDDEGQEPQRSMKILRIGGTKRNIPEPDLTWTKDENIEFSQVPKEFFENVKLTAPRVQENRKKYSELWEAESIGMEQNSQNQFNGGDEEANDEIIIQEREPDAHQEKTAKDNAVRKLMKYFETARSHQGEEEGTTDYMNTERSGSHVRNSLKSPVPSSEVRNQKQIQSADHNPLMAMNQKLVKDSSSNEFEDFTHYDSMEFGRAAISSAEHEALGNHKSSHDETHPASRSTRAIDNVEQIMDQEMIFQDDNNLKDCDCRVIRGMKTSRGSENRKNQRHQLDRIYSKDRGDRGRFRNREGPPTTKTRGRFDEDYMHTTRLKRQAGSSIDDVEEMIVGEQAESIEDSSGEFDSESVETESAQASDETTGGQDDTSIQDDLVTAPIDPILKEVKDLLVNKYNKSLTVDNEKANLTLNENQRDEKHKVLAVEERVGNAVSANKTADLAVKNDEQDIKTSNPVKRHNKEEAAVPLPREFPEVLEQVSTNDSKANQLFLVSRPKDLEADSKTLDQTSQKNLTWHTLGLAELGENLQSSSSEFKESAIGLRSVVTETKIQDSSSATTSNPDEVVQKENSQIGQRDSENSTVGTAKGLFEDSQAFNWSNETEEEADVEKRVKLEVKKNITDNMNKLKTNSSTDEKVSKLLKAVEESTKTPRKTSPQAKQVIKVVDPAKAIEARLATRSAALVALKKENDSRKTKTLLGNLTKKRLQEQLKIKAKQKQRAKQLKKLRDNLRIKKTMTVKEHRDELMDELGKAIDDKERNLKRREIVDIINDDVRIDDIVDQEKLDYLMQNKPINYEMFGDDNPTENSERRMKYVPKMIEIVRPLHEVRERKVKVLGQPIRHSNDPKILAYPDPEESSNSEVIRKILREGIDLTDHKVRQQAGKSFYSIVESLENPMIYRYSNEKDSGEVFGLADSEEAQLSSIGETNYEEQIEPISDEESEDEVEDSYHRDYRRCHAILKSQKKRQKNLKSSNQPPRLTRNTSNNQNQYMCLKEDSEDVSIEDQDELFKLVKDNGHYMALPVQKDEDNNKEKYISKKKFPKNSDYDYMSKYKTPKYARLAPEKIEADRRVQNPATSMEDYQANTFDNEDLLQEIASKNTRRKTKGSNAEDELCSTQRKRNDVAQLKAELEMIDELDLDEALNSNKYELLMLIPVKNQKKSRQRRSLKNELSRDEEDSTSNNIPLDTVRNKVADNLITDTSTIHIVENANPSIEQNGKVLDGYAIQEIVRSIPQTVANKVSSIDDQGIPALIEVAIPKLEATLTNGLGKARHISESFEKFIDGFDDRFNQKEIKFSSHHPESIEVTKQHNNSPISSDIFNTTITSIKKFFNFLEGMVHTFRFN